MKRIIRIAAVLTVLASVLSVIAIHPATAVTNDAIKAKRQEINELQSLLDAQKETSNNARKKINEIKADLESTSARINELIEEIDSLDNEIITTEELISNYEEYIVLKEQEIEQTEGELSSQEETLVAFLRYDYESGSSQVKTLEFLLNSASLSDFLSNIHYIGTLMDYQDHLINNLEDTVTKYEGQKYDLREAKEEKERYAIFLDEKMAEATTLKEEAMEHVVKLREDQEKYSDILESSESVESSIYADIEKAQKEEAKLVAEEEERIRKEEEERKRREEEERKKREAEEAARKAREEDSASAKAKLAEANAAAYGDGYLWPLPMNKFVVTGWFGYEPSPFGSGTRFHKAVDLGASKGTPIYAAAAGKVITAKYSSSYGNYVIILHSNGYSTLYAHASKLKVSVGDKVKQGDVIALVGTTGESTGNHLHFEIIQPDGRTREDPMLYFKKVYNLHKNDCSRYDYLNNPRRTVYTV